MRTTTSSDKSKTSVKSASSSVTNKYAAALDNLSKAAIKQKLSTTLGCDWISEITVSFRKHTRSSLPSPRLVSTLY